MSYTQSEADEIVTGLQGDFSRDELTRLWALFKTGSDYLNLAIIAFDQIPDVDVTELREHLEDAREVGALVQQALRK